MEIVRLSNDTKKYCTQLEKVRDLKVISSKVDAFLNNPNNIAFFALEGEQVIGFVWGYVLERLDSEPMLYIHSVDVIESHRQKYVGTSILNEFIHYFKTNNFRNMFLITDADNIPANMLYQSLGGELETDKNLYIFK